VSNLAACPFQQHTRVGVASYMLATGANGETITVPVTKLGVVNIPGRVETIVHLHGGAKTPERALNGRITARP
jgi:hypothetical protein